MTLLRVGNMSCGHCVATVKDALEALDGVSQADVDLEGGTATVTGTGDVEAMLKACDAVGHPASVIEPLTLKVANMMCDHCVGSVKGALTAVPGVMSAEVDLEAGTATVMGTADIEAMLQACDAVGHPTSTIEPLTLNVANMMCGHCVDSVTGALTAVPGVMSAVVDLEAGTATVMGTADVQALIEACDAINHPATLPGGDETTHANGAANIPGSRLRRKSRDGIQEGGRTGEDGGSGSAPAMRKGDATAASRSEQSAASFHRANGYSPNEDRDTATRMSGSKSAANIATTEQPPAVLGKVLNGIAAEEHCTLSIDGMTCASCVANVERKLRSIAGVAMVSVSLMGKRGNIGYQPDLVSAAQLVAGINSIGYKAEEMAQDAKQESVSESYSAEADDFKRQLLGACVFSIPALLLSMVLPMFPPLRAPLQTPMPGMGGGVTIRVVVLLFLVTPVQFYFGAGFYQRAWMAVQHGNATMDVLVVLGTSTAYIYSVAFTLLCWQSAGELGCENECFETSAMLITFMLLGKYLEASAKGKASEAIGKLVKLQPPTAMLCASVQAEPVEVPVSSLAKGDLCKVVPGAKVPVDGTVSHGSSTVDEAMITGEATPVPKAAADAVVGGSVNGSGVLWVSVGAVGNDTVLAKIMRLVSEAQMRKPAVQAQADRVAAHFVPAVVIVALATYLAWVIAVAWKIVPQALIDFAGVADGGMLAFEFGSAVLVIACPCALGLATPTAVMVGSGVAASLGILFKGGDVLEKASQVSAVIFDKTGTLTHGTLKLTHTAVWQDAVSEAELLTLAASAERDSEHPIGRAIVAHARGLGLPLRDSNFFEVTAGSGLKCYVASVPVVVGNRAWLQQNGIGLSAAQEQHASSFEARGATVIFVASNETLAGMIALADEPKPEAAAVVAHLQREGVMVWMVSGDNERTAKHIASRLGITNVLAGVKPQHKAERVKALQDTGRHVAMVGDGINDAPALAIADVGIAVGSGTDVAIETADVVLMKSMLHDVVTTLHLSAVVMRRIKLNFFWAICYNVVGIPVAAGALYPYFLIKIPPMFAGFAMAMSSVSVVCSSLLLRCYAPPPLKLKRKNGMVDMV